MKTIFGFFSAVSAEGFEPSASVYEKMGSAVFLCLCYYSYVKITGRFRLIPFFSGLPLFSSIRGE